MNTTTPERLRELAVIMRDGTESRSTAQEYAQATIPDVIIAYLDQRDTLLGLLAEWFTTPSAVTFANDLRGRTVDAIAGLIPCPQDTDGDGNCGAWHCPFCGERS